MTRRVLGLLLVALLPLAAVTTPAAGQRAAAKLQTLGVVTTYTCSTQYGNGSADVGIRVRLPRSVKEGAVGKARPIGIAIAIPEEVVDQMREYGIESVAGSSDDAPLKIGSKPVPVVGLRIPETPLPDSGPLVLRGGGKVKAFSMAHAGTYRVDVPRRVVADISGQIQGFPAETQLTCTVADGAPVRLGTLRVTRG